MISDNKNLRQNVIDEAKFCIDVQAGIIDAIIIDDIIRDDNTRLLDDLHHSGCISEKTYFEFKNRMKI